MSARRSWFSRWGFSSRPPRILPSVVPLSSESELVPRFAGEAGVEQNLVSWRYTWKITNFTSLTPNRYCSEVFVLGYHAWRIVIDPNWIDPEENLSIFLQHDSFPWAQGGWSINTRFLLILVDQNNYRSSQIFEAECKFTATQRQWGAHFLPLSALRNRPNRYLVNNALTVVAEIFAPLPPAPPTQLVEPPASIPEATPTDKFVAYFTNLEEIIKAAQSSSTREGSKAINKKRALLTSESPNLEEVEKAKLSLKECLSDIFKLNAKDRLAEAMSTLSIAKSGLSLDQKESAKASWANFDEFISDFLTFEQDNAELELQKLRRDQTFATMQKNHETHISYVQVLGDLTQEEEELIKKLEEVNSRREKLMSDWEILMVESEEAKSGYKDLEKKEAETEEKKRIAEERLS